jgi:hypothetical protein
MFIRLRLSPLRTDARASNARSAAPKRPCGSTGLMDYVFILPNHFNLSKLAV